MGSSSRGSGPLPDRMCWWRAGVPPLESVLAQPTCHLRRCVGPLPTLQSTMWRRVMSTDWWPHWRTSKSGVPRAWLQPMIFGEYGGPGNGERRWREPAYEPVAHLCASIVPGHAELAALSRLGLGLLVAGLVWPSKIRVQTREKDSLRSGPRAWGARGPGRQARQASRPPLPRRYKPIARKGQQAAAGLGKALQRP